MPTCWRLVSGGGGGAALGLAVCAGVLLAAPAVSVLLALGACTGAAGASSGVVCVGGRALAAVNPDGLVSVWARARFAMKGMQTAGRHRQDRGMSGGWAGRRRRSLTNAVATPETGRTGLLWIGRVDEAVHLVHARGRARLTQRGIHAAGSALCRRRDADEPLPKARRKRGNAAVVADPAEPWAVSTGVACRVAVKTKTALLIPPAALASGAERAAHAQHARGGIAALTREALLALVTVGRDARAACWAA